MFFLIPFGSLIFLIVYWYFYGKDPQIKKSIVPQYEPPEGLKPAQISLILKQKIESRDLAATLIDLAVRGYLKIKEIENTGIKAFIVGKKDYELEKLKIDESLKEYESLFLNEIFSEKEKVTISELEGKSKFYKNLDKIIEKICEETTEEGYFLKNPFRVEKRWSDIGYSIFFLGSFLFLVLQFFSSLEHSGASLKYPGAPLLFFINYSSAIFFSLSITGFLFIIFSKIMPKKSVEGTEILWHILGFRDYIKTAEKYRAKFYEKENIFELYLPYAIIFNLVNKWAKAFEGIYRMPPQWYEGRYPSGFSPKAFSNSLNSALGKMNNVFAFPTGKSGLGGKGFSGGGRGGGGGRSW